MFHSSSVHRLSLSLFSFLHLSELRTVAADTPDRLENLLGGYSAAGPQDVRTCLKYE